MSVVGYLTDRRILFLLAIVISLAALDIAYGGPHLLHFGIEFVGGTQIPVALEQPVAPDQMANLISILQQRVSTFGLKQVTVEGIGNSELYVTIPSVSPSEINATINIINSQGIFQGIVSGREALNGSSILSGSIGSAPPTVFGTNVSWSVSFYLTQKAADKFARVVFGQAYQPLYLFLDRPTQSIVLLNGSALSSGGALAGLTQSQAVAAVEGSVVFGNRSIPVEILSKNASNWNLLSQFFTTHRASYNTVILEKSTPSYIASQLTMLNYTLHYISSRNMTPQFEIITPAAGANIDAVNTWPAIGLLSAPRLDPGVTNGSSGVSYVISGGAPVNYTQLAAENYAANQSKSISSILSGGALPVPVIVGTPSTTPATLGSKFLVISGIAGLLAVLSVATLITIRYRKLFLVVPIVLTVLAELFIIVSVIGLLGTIDLSAVAGMIAVVGTGVDAQIIITDEVLTNTHESAVKSRLKGAFYIIWVDAALIVIAMLPLLFSTSLVTVIGFSESTIMGALLGILITRPAYGAIVSRHYQKGEDNAKTLPNMQ
ncbi:MAG: hypothetical protein KGH61_03645 [Candidatus Micrarchaeota archaeon]|nr:hypothetical protein [Candidatus Micrarchaeota archaeon]MDE1848016.1 hypothetical protein [Candidatus Micrarchaeota archaeon]MDE1864607.1 hypothetical protein [Candidatus Micrarchaeota archaeon]